jgi:hypothetical protein
VIIGNDTLTTPSIILLYSTLASAGVPRNLIKNVYAPNIPKSLKAGETKELVAFDPALAQLPEKPSKNIAWRLEYESIYSEKSVLIIPKLD